MQQLFNNASGKWLLVALCYCLSAVEVQGKTKPVKHQHVLHSVDLTVVRSGLQESPFNLYQTEADSTKSKVIAAILAMPLPFGWLGLHRIYLGAKPVIPILYLVTFGGVLGILPFIDMMVLILSKDTKPFFKNSRILMWHKENT